MPELHKVFRAYLTPGADMRTTLTLTFFVALLITLAGTTLSLGGCGRIAPPLPPESVSPRSVLSLQVKGQPEGVNFTWKTPMSNRRGRDLKMIDGYFIYRKEVSKRSDIVDDSVPYKLVDTVADTHLLELDERRKAAEKADLPSRTLKPKEDLTKFDFTDATVSPGTTYLYKIVPFNQGDVEGGAEKLVKVLFRGDASEVSMLDNPDPYDGVIASAGDA